LNRNIFYLNIINTITNWQVSLSKICHKWPNNTVTHEWAQLMSELHCLVMHTFVSYHSSISYSVSVVFISSVFYDPEAFYIEPEDLPSKPYGGVSVLKGRKVKLSLCFKNSFYYLYY
jgi:hypothetical protein